MKPKISVIFTSYNHKEFLVEAVESIINQTFKDFELIIIDDCSTDGSQDLLLNYIDDTRVKLWLLTENTGSYVHSSNLGASKAESDFIIFAQCDDFANKNQLEKLYEIMQIHNNVGVVYSSSTLVDSLGNDIVSDYSYRSRNFKMKCSTDTVISGLQMRNYFYHACVIPNLSAALIKRALFEKVGGFSSKYLVLADWDFWLRISVVCDFYYIREPLNNFRQHGATIRNSVKLRKQLDEVFEMFYGFFDIMDVGFIERTETEFSISQIWINYFWSNKSAWIKCIFSFLKVAIKRNLGFPIIFAITLFAYPFGVLWRRIVRYID